LHKGENSYFLKKLNDLQIKLADEIIVLSVFVKNIILNKNKQKKIHVVPHGILENNFIKTKEVRETKNLLFFGRISEYKGVEILMESIAENPNIVDKLIIAGKSIYPIEYIKHFKIEIIDEYLSEERIGDLFNWADALILPYVEGSQSGVIGLGVFAEIPMICAKVGGLQEQLNQDEALWILPNKEDIVSGITRLFNNKELMKKIKEKLSVKKKELSWEDISSRIHQIIGD
jgi:glycosyltransferase involved in cell wall biosynthesis